jgi:uncharacterized Zn ribbon protein
MVRFFWKQITLKRGTVVQGIYLTDDRAEIDCWIEKLHAPVLRTEFAKKT